MANRKISEFTALTAPASGDTFAILDVDASGIEVNKKITYANVLGKAPDGTAAAPAFSFSSDTNSGISGGSDTLVLSTGGTAAISVDSSQNVTLSANLTVSGTTTVIDTTTLTVKDKNIEIAKGNGNDAAVDGAGITIDSTDGDKTWNWVDSTDAWTSSENIDLASGKVLKVAGTQVLSATNFTGTSAVATAVTVADESSDTSCNVLFTTAATGNLAPKSGTNLTFNSDTGALTATSFVGALTGNVTGNAATSTALATSRNFSLTGEITASDTGFDGSADCDIATTIADNVVDEANLKVSNSPTNGYYLQAQSGNTGGLTWAAVAQYTTPLTTQGDILFRDGSGDQRLAAGTSGYFLKTQGSGADPVWAAVPAGVGGASGVDFNDDVKARWGTGNDLEIYHTGTDSYIANTTGNLYVKSPGDIFLQPKSSEAGVYIRDDSAVELYFDGVKKLETTSWGTQVTGNFVATGLIDLSDGNGTSTSTIALGDDDDLKIYHDGTDSYITNATNQLIYKAGSDHKFFVNDGAETTIWAKTNGAVELFYDNSKKFETTSTGTTVTGVATVSNGIIETAITIATNHTITTNYNAMSAGPVTVSATVTVPSGSVWTVI